MSRSAVSMIVFAIYLFILGGILLIVPNFQLTTFGLPETNEVWIRVVGMLVFLLGIYYVMAARRDMREFFLWTVYVRSTVIVFFIVFVLAKLAKPVLILFGGVDLMAAIWTALALRADSRADGKAEAKAA